MPTLTDTILLNGSGIQALLAFRRLTAPQVTSGGAESDAVVPFHTESDGDFSLSLAGGGYAMEWRIRRGPINRIEFTMPSEGGPYSLADLVGSDNPAFESMLSVQGWDALKALTQHVNREMRKLSYLDTEGDGQGGWYEYDAQSTLEEFKPDVAIPNDVEEENPGRWLKHPYP